DQVRRMALLGSGAGTAADQFLAIYGPDAVVDAVEIDQQIVDMARTSFGMRDSVVARGNPNYHVHVADGRTWLASQTGKYDVIGVDAYDQPYIPFHLTTVEFFRMVRDHLAPNGVVVLNAGLGADGDTRLALALATTMREVFPNLFVLETAQIGNWMLVGSMQHIGDGAANFAANYQQINQPALRTTMALVQGFPFLSNQRGDLVLYDDHAPVERLVDEMIFRAISQ
ncbi:MAG: fused MFS/spermidine synthase, partial [Chloroflexales bacterium]|nr:fused MFS/spermidine synthase [Chloroflexales bacterium]